jgi:hypothetical protein
MIGNRRGVEVTLHGSGPCYLRLIHTGCFFARDGEGFQRTVPLGDEVDPRAGSTGSY